MARIKIDYGIDLGTTNSAICRMEKGEPVIIKTDVLKDTMPSCVSFTKRKSVKAGDAAFNDMKSDKRRASKSGTKTVSNAYVEFKRTMGTDTLYHSSFMDRDYSSEELSAEVLKTLKSFVTDENLSSVVITVPAKFTVTQKTATLKAAELAGFKHCELLQEPIAASMAYGLKADEKNGYWLVFDFGGGTFDAALLRVEDGIMQVFDTEGDNYLGGKNLDYAIVDNIIIPYLKENFSIEGILADKDKKEVLRDAMKTYAEDVKNQLSFKDSEDIISNLGDLGEDEDGEEIELDLTVTQKQAFDVMRPYFQKAVDICKELLKRNNMDGGKLSKVILVGGPTHCPLIRQMLKEQITENVDTSIDPMTAVAVGAALYASTIDVKDIDDSDLQTDTVKLKVGYESTTVETSEWVTIELDKSAGNSSKVFVELVRSDKSWASGKSEVGEQGTVLEANLIEGKANSFNVVCYDERGNSIPCFPDEITIIQGSKVGAAPLPYNIGVGVWDVQKNKEVFIPAKGLEKNRPLPATGVVNDKRTGNKLRPGVDTDILRIPIYQADEFDENNLKSTSCYEYVADVVITGDDVDQQIKENAVIDITVKVDASEQMTIEAYFPETDTTVEKKLDTSKLQSVEEAEKRIPRDLAMAQNSIDRLKDEGCDTSALQDALDRVKEEADNSSEKKAVLQHLKEVLRKIEDLDGQTEWSRLERQLRDEFDRLEKANDDLGNEKTTQLVNQLRTETDNAIRAKDVKIGREVLENIKSLFFQLTMIYQLIGLIESCSRQFGQIRWKDAARARQLVNMGMSEISNQPTVEKLQPIAVGLLDLMPDNEARRMGSGIKNG